MNIKKLSSRALAFAESFNEHKAKSRNDAFTWYPYGTLNNFLHFEKLFQDDPDTNLLALAGEKRIADIGAADGDTAFFLESLGYKVDAIDYAPSNYNGCQGIRFLKEELNSSIGLLEIDLDAHFELPSEHYGLAFFLGILYHLKNPYGVLEKLSKLTNYALISTRIAKYNVADDMIGSGNVNLGRVRIEDIPSAYLVAPMESNNDATNFWMFTDAGLKRLFDRCGWDIEAYVTLGDTKNSDPASINHDERAFALLRSRSAVDA
jgi:hypothetical protein